MRGDPQKEPVGRRSALQSGALVARKRRACSHRNRACHESGEESLAWSMPRAKMGGHSHIRNDGARRHQGQAIFPLNLRRLLQDFKADRVECIG